MTPYLIHNQFWLHPRKSVKLMRNMSFHFICRIDLRLTHLALPNKLFYAFSPTFPLISYSFEHKLFLSTEAYFILPICPAQEPRPGCTRTQVAGSMMQRKSIGFGARYTGVQLLTLLFTESGIGRGSSPARSSQRNKRECSWHTGGPWGPHVPHSYHPQQGPGYSAREGGLTLWVT